MFKKAALALVLFIGAAATASAGCEGLFAANQYCGVGSSPDFAKPLTLGGDCTLSNGSITCTTINGVAPGTMAFQNASAVAISGGSITGLGTPTNASDAATKSYVDTSVVGLVIHTAAKWATAAVLPNTPTYANGAAGVGATLTAGSNAAIVVDGGSPALNDRVLVKDQASALQNGCYTVTTVGSGAAAWVLTRCTDFDQATTGEIATSAYFFVSSGSVNASSAWTLNTTGAITVGTTALTFSQFSASQTFTAGTGINIAGNVISLASGAALANLSPAAASTLFGNSATSSGSPSFFTPGSLTSKASPTVSDLLVIADQAATGQLKQVTVGSLPLPSLAINSQTTDYTIATSDCSKIVQAGTGGTGQFTITLPSPAAFSAGCYVRIVNADTARGKILSGFPARTPLILYPGQQIDVEIANSVWLVANFPTRYRTTSALTTFVDVTNGNDNNDCLAATTGACATIQKAYDNLANYIDAANTAPTIQIADGTYAAGLVTQRNIPGLNLQTVIQGNCTTPSNVNISTNAATAVFELGGGQGVNSVTLQIKCMKLTNAGGGGGMRVWGGGAFVMFDKLVFGPMGTGSLIGAFHNAVVTDLGGSFTVSGGGLAAFLVQTGGQLYLDSTVVTCTGAFAFSGAFAYVTDLGNLMAGGVTFSGCGSITGTRALGARNVNIFTGAGGASFFPGNAVNSITAGAQYN